MEDEKKIEGQQDATGAENPGDGERRFTQAELDQKVKERLAREKAKYSDYDELKTQAEKFQEWQESQKSEVDKLREAAEKAAQERDQALAKSREELIRAKFVSAASALGAAHPEDAYRLADRSGVEYEDGKVSGVEEAVKVLLDAGRLPLAKRSQAPDLDGGAGSGNRDSEKPRLTPEQEAMAEKLHLTPEQYAKSLRR